MTEQAKTTSMVERVARAICSGTVDPDGQMNDGTPYWRLYVPEAHAAIEAMREPTDRMSVAGGLKCEELMFEVASTGVIFMDMATVFSTMIDAALSEEGE